MKKILLPALIASLLAACASDKGPVDENKFKKKESAVKKADKNEGLVTPECVTLEGKFVKQGAENSPQEYGSPNFNRIILATKKEDGKFSYSFDNVFVMADGETRQADTIKAKGVCDDTSFELTITAANDEVTTAKFKRIDEKTVNIEVKGSALSDSLNGNFNKEEEAAAPAPANPPEPVTPEDEGSVEE